MFYPTILGSIYQKKIYGSHNGPIPLNPRQKRKEEIRIGIIKNYFTIFSNTLFSHTKVSWSSTLF